VATFIRPWQVRYYCLIVLPDLGEDLGQGDSSLQRGLVAGTENPLTTVKQVFGQRSRLVGVALTDHGDRRGNCQ